MFKFFIFLASDAQCKRLVLFFSRNPNKDFIGRYFRESSMSLHPGYLAFWRKNFFLSQVMGLSMQKNFP